MGAASSGSSKRYASICQAIETSSGSRVRRLGPIAISSNPYASRPRLPRPVSISLKEFPADGASAVGLSARSFSTAGVVRGLDGHLHVVRVALLQPGGRDPD